MNKQIVTVGILSLALLVLPQCDWSSSDEGSSRSNVTNSEGQSNGSSADSKNGVKGEKVSENILLYSDDKDLITVKDFQEYLELFIESQPEVRQILQFMPNAEEEIYKNMQSEIVLDLWAEKSGIDKKSEFKKELEQINRIGRQKLAVKYFMQQHPVSVTDAELKQYYEENKDNIPQLVESQGGITAKGVKFDSEGAAKDFIEKARAAANIDSAAKSAGLTVKTFKSVGEQSFDVEAPIRKRLTEVKTFPTIDLVKVGDKAFWVIEAVAKEPKKYVSFDKVKDGIKGLVEQQKTGEMFAKEIDKLKKEYNLKENLSYFEKKMKDAEEQQKKMMEQFQKQQEAQENGTTQSEQPMKSAQSGAIAQAQAA